MKAGHVDFIDKYPAMNTFINFLIEYYGNFKNEEINEIVIQFINMINQGAKPETMLDYIQRWVEVLSLEISQKILNEIMNLQDNTRQWILKGYTTNELFQEEKKCLNPLPVGPFVLDETDYNLYSNVNETKVVNIRNFTKIGRNDRCPCLVY